MLSLLHVKAGADGLTMLLPMYVNCVKNSKAATSPLCRTSLHSAVPAIWEPAAAAAAADRVAALLAASLVLAARSCCLRLTTVTVNGVTTCN